MNPITAYVLGWLYFAIIFALLLWGIRKTDKPGLRSLGIFFAIMVGLGLFGTAFIFGFVLWVTYPKWSR